MAIEFSGYLDVGRGVDGLIPLGYFDVSEQYNGGWTARAVLSAQSSGKEEVTLPGMISIVTGAGIVPGDNLVLRLAVRGDESGAWVRSWPCFVKSVSPFHSEQYAGSHCVVTLVDAVSFLSGNAIWGAFRGFSAAETVGGALSLAAGTAGAATLNPAVENHSAITIVDSLREELDFVPYAIAAGQSLGRWLGEFYGLLGIRMEMLGASNGALSIILTDGTPGDTPLNMTLADGGDSGEDGEEASGRDGELAVVGVDGNRGAAARAVLLDDPTKGMFRRIGGGPVGALVSGVEVSLDEAAERSRKNLSGRAAELVVVSAESRQPALRPGRSVSLDTKLLSANDWQVFRAEHVFKGSVYGNRLRLMKAEYSWHPLRPSPESVKIVPGTVDAGNRFLSNEPVPRDELGRIHVRFPFVPTGSWEERAMKMFDTDFSGTITKDDFGYLLRQRYNSSGETASEDDYDPNATEKAWRGLDAEGMRTRLKEVAAGETGASAEQRKEAEFLADAEAREQELKDLHAGKYDDPFPGRETADLAEEELERREVMAEKRLGVFKYMAWKRAVAFEEAGGDHDRDGRLTELDEAMSEEMRKVFENPAEQQRVKRLSEEQERLETLAEHKRAIEEVPPEERSGEERKLLGRIDAELEKAPAISDADKALAEEYEKLFGEEPDDDSARLIRLRADAADEQQPPRLPLPVVEPMAGGLHGFVTAHRQGDACRVAVYNVLNAEIIGFQYRRDRDLTDAIRGATAGIVVEHDLRNAWSGILFRMTE